MEEEIDLKGLFEILWNKKIIIVVVSIIFSIIGFIYSKVLITPKYTAKASMLLVSKNTSTGTETTITSSDISLNNNLIATYKELARSTSVVKEVLDNLNITDITEESLKGMIDVTSVTSTQILNISVTDIDRNRATQITNELTKVFSEKVKEYYKIENINVVDQAEIPNRPSNINTTKTVALFFIIGFVLTIGTILIINTFDTTVKSTKDIEKTIKVPVLAELPQCDFAENSIKRRRK